MIIGCLVAMCLAALATIVTVVLHCREIRKYAKRYERLRDAH